MISESAIMAKLNQYASTSTGKKKMKDCIQSARDTGKKLASGDIVPGRKEMCQMAEALIGIIRGNLPESISEVGNTLTYSQPRKLEDGSYEIIISFDKASLFRPSLTNSGEYYTKFNGHTGAGISNIVALFNNGYSEDSIGRVYGSWSSHDDVRIHNRQTWDGMNFMQTAETEFNTVYGSKYNTTVQLGSDYTE